MGKSWAWISGWGISPHRFARHCSACYPEDTHHVLPPTEHAVEAALETKPDAIGAYSLGSLLLLSELECIPLSTECQVVAPVLGFCQEAGLGGTTPAASIQRLAKRLQKNPQAGLQLFYRLAKLQPPLCDGLPYRLEDMIWGLEVLQSRQAPPPHRPVKAIIGKSDPLLIGTTLSAYFPDATLIEAGHDYHDLLHSHHLQS